MISNHDRSGYFGASDTKQIMGKWDTLTFGRWWRTKQGYEENNFTTEAMLAGTAYEHPILEALEVDGLEMDKQVILEDLKLRVNLDGNTANTIYEVKTYRWGKGFTMPKAYQWQVWVQMFATGIRKAYIVTYGLEEGDYLFYGNPIDLNRMGMIRIKYDERWIKEEYLPRLRYLAECLEKGKYPMRIF